MHHSRRRRIGDRHYTANCWYNRRNAGATTEEPLTALGMVVTGTAVGGVLGLLGSDVLCRLLVDVGLRL